jgi:galactoside O-acetyltransferase
MQRILSYGKHVSIQQLRDIGVKFSGSANNIQISERAVFHNPENITIGDNVRIDDGVLLSANSGEIILDNYIHIARNCQLYSGSKIHLHDFSGLSSDIKLYGITDSYDGSGFTNPTCPLQYRNIQTGDIILNKHVVIGTSSILLPHCILADGVAIGAMSLLTAKNTKKISAWTIWAGNPLTFVTNRKSTCLELEARLITGIHS